MIVAIPNWIPSRRIAVFLLAVCVAAPLMLARPAFAMETLAKYAILLDADTGAILFEKAADEPMAPASMSKMMTAYIVFDKLKKGQIKLDDKLTVSENAWRKGGADSGGSTMFLPNGATVTIGDLLQGVIVQSGNDASITLAEGLAGSEEAFAEEMTKRAREIGMTHSTFRNATGLPDPEESVTARDLSTLARRTIQDFPEYYHIYSEKEFTYNNIKQGNRNPLLYRKINADGLKTGHTSVSGYGITASVLEDGRRLILVVNGLPSMQARADESERLFQYGLREFDNYQLFKSGETVADAAVWLGDAETVPLVAPKGVVVTLPRKSRPDMKVVVDYDAPIPAPVAQGAPAGKVVVTAPDVAPAEVEVVAGQTVDRLGFFGRIGAAVAHLVLG